VVNKQGRVYNALREGILSGAYGPGYRLVIDRIAEDNGVSTLPVREAIRRLEAEGLVVFRPNVGALVTPADPQQFDESMRLLAVLEGYATAVAAPQLDAAALREIEAANTRMERAVAALDVLGIGNANREFHRLIVAHCGNAPLIALLEDVGRRLDAIRRTVFTHIPYRGTASIDEHRRLIALIREGASARKIEQAAREHKLHTLEAFHQWQIEHGQDGGGERLPAAPPPGGPVAAARPPRRRSGAKQA